MHFAWTDCLLRKDQKLLITHYHADGTDVNWLQMGVLRRSFARGQRKKTDRWRPKSPESSKSMGPRVLMRVFRSWDPCRRSPACAYRAPGPSPDGGDGSERPDDSVLRSMDGRKREALPRSKPLPRLMNLPAMTANRRERNT